ncbi:MAG: hypothetical protein L0Y71_06935 [Gemmataceae bacterium]|nr:hypothetical protein [Gemmataceae bacterium]
MRRIAILGALLAVTAGCQSPCCRQREATARPGLFAPPTTPIPQGFAPGGAIASGGVAPGAATPFPVVPPGPSAAPNGPPTATPFPTMPPPAPPAPNGVPGAGARIESQWQPAEARAPSPFDGKVLLAPPEPEDAKEAQKRLYPPQVDAAKQPPTALPVGIAQFAHVLPKVSAGLRPAHDEGLDWLKKHDYRTVLHIRLPGENDAADRKAAEQHGLTYVSLEVSPNLLDKEKVDEFIRLVRDAKLQPLFVYDRDGALAGGLWYLWFRLVEEAADDVARVRARSLGLREDRDGAHRDMWQSAQRFLADLKSP